MQISKETNNLYLNSSAYVNYCREEVLAGEIDCSDLLPRLNEIVKHFSSLDISDNAKAVIDLYSSKKKLG